MAAYPEDRNHAVERVSQVGVSFESHFRANEILVDGFNEHLIAVEERLSDIEGKSKT